MRFVLELLSVIAEALFLLGISAWIGLWWVPGIGEENIEASLTTATLALVLGGVYLRKHVIVDWRKSLSIRGFFYMALAFCAVTGYLYGVFFIWLA